MAVLSHLLQQRHAFYRGLLAVEVLALVGLRGLQQAPRLVSVLYLVISGVGVLLDSPLLPHNRLGPTANEAMPRALGRRFEKVVLRRRQVVIYWTLALASASPSRIPNTNLREAPDTLVGPTYTFSQPLSPLEETRTLPRTGNTHPAPISTTPDTPPTPVPWTPQFSYEEWVYTDGSDIKGHPRLGVAVVHIPTNTTIYIDAAGCEETRTIMRAELVAIHTALSRFADHSWLGIFTDSLSSIQAIRLHHQRPGLSRTPNYHHHMLLLQGITDLMETRQVKGYSTVLRKIRAHTHIRGNDLADTAAKLAVTDFDTLPGENTLGVEVGSIAP